jgi:hypothetical protein
VSWRHRISIVVLAVLMALPIAGTLCAMQCDSAMISSIAAHHRSGTRCEERARPSSGPQLDAASDHDCSTHSARLPQIVTTSASRADGLVTPSQLAAVPVHNTARTFADLDATFDYRTPPDSSSFAAPTLVLRV